MTQAEEAVSIEQAWLRGRLVWPGLTVPMPRFAEAYLACCQVKDAAPSCPEDLYLAVACLCGDAAALRLFDERFVALTPRHTRTVALTESERAELPQIVRVRMLTGPKPKLASYLGAGPLGGWLRVAATRIALDLVDARRAKDEVHGEMDLLINAAASALEADASVTTRLEGTLHRPLVRQVMAEALSRLQPREKTILRMHLLEDVPVEGIAKLFGVHRATVARWFSAIRAQIFAYVNDRLALRIGTSVSEVRSLLRACQFDLNLSLSRVLEPVHAGSEPPAHAE